MSGLSLVLAAVVFGAPCLERAPDLSALSEGLARYVDEQGDVDYRRIAAEGSPLFAKFVDDAISICPQTYQGFSVDQRIALLINLYNAWVIEFMTGSDGRPTSILKARIRGKSVFDAPLIQVRWHSKSLTLNSIEKSLLPAVRIDPRYHFALVCGAKSCPKLRRQPYRAQKLNEDLTHETLKFLKDPSRNQLSGKVWRVSRLFDWYRAEFGNSKASIIDWVLKQLGPEAKRPEGLEFLEYDWAPNQRK